MSYDPRTATGISTEPVGSLPRPSTLQAAYADYDAGKISREALEKEQEAADVQDQRRLPPHPDGVRARQGPVYESIGQR